MAKKTSSEPPVGQPTVTPQVAIARISDLKKRIEATAASGSIGEHDAEQLDYVTESTLRAALGANHPDIGRIRYAGLDEFGLSGTPSEIARQEAEHWTLRARLLKELIDQLRRDIAEAPPPVPAAPARASPLQHVSRLVERFHRVAKRLRARHDKRATLDVKDEYDVQDLLHALLTLHFDDIRPEEWTPSYAGKSSRMDFLLKAEQVVIEVKMTRDSLGEKEVGDQLIVDIARYRVHPDCKTLICFVYDPLGRIGNPDGLESDLSGVRDGVTVKVVIAPKS
jgi:hypothetical protein